MTGVQLAGGTLLEFAKHRTARVKASSAQAEAIRYGRRQTDKLFCLVHDEYLYERPVPEFQRLIFYLGHMDAFDWIRIAEHQLNEPAFDPSLDNLFLSEIPGSLSHDTAKDWPAPDTIRTYVTHARERLDQILENAPAATLQMAIEHRMIHAELLACLMHNMPYRQKKPVPVPQWHILSQLPNRPLRIPAGRCPAPLPGTPLFTWNHEFDAAGVHVPEFNIDRRKVTNGDYLEFVRRGGAPPHFWVNSGGKWMWRGMFGLAPLSPDTPAYVTHRQAVAYTEWKGKSLPSEAQFQRAAYACPNNDEPRKYPWGNSPPTRAQGNFDFCLWDPVPTDTTPAGDSAFGVSQLVGNGWEWTSTLYDKYHAGRQTSARSPGYPNQWTEGPQYVLKGASPRTAACLLRPSYRIAANPDTRFLYAAFRCVSK